MTAGTAAAGATDAVGGAAGEGVAAAGGRFNLGGIAMFGICWGEIGFGGAMFAGIEGATGG